MARRPSRYTPLFACKFYVATFSKVDDNKGVAKPMRAEFMKFRRLIFFISIIFFTGIFISCGAGYGQLQDMQTTENTKDTISEYPDDNKVQTTSDANQGVVFHEDIYDLVFLDLADFEFFFGSGVGGWGTVIKISPDGTFNGYDSNLFIGDGSPNEPGRTLYESHFFGKFTDLKRIGAYTYSMKCESLSVTGTIGEENIDGTRIITLGEIDYENGDEFLLYLPGKEVKELPENFLI